MTRPVITEKLGKFNLFFGGPAPKTEPGEGIFQIIVTHGSEHSNI